MPRLYRGAYLPGHHVEPAPRPPCPACGGSRTQWKDLGNGHGINLPCPTCGGSGTQ